ncbi:hypothetical protein PWT90_05623 [Aphanocladium album]|nr:hypothetical protein PWT90_05623 [Aphanocladium album]
MALHSTQYEAWEDDAVYLGRDDVSDFNPDNILPLPEDKLEKVRAWLQPTAYEDEDGEFRRHLASHLHGTGEWLVQSREYLRWHDDQNNGLLWVRGIPGSGNPPLQIKLAEYTAERRTLESISSIDLWKDLRSALRHIPKAFIVVDALDEMNRGDEMQSFLEHLAELGRWRPANTKVIMTSRPVAHIESVLRRSNAISIRLRETLVDLDIATFVAHHLAKSTINAEGQERIKTAVPGHANGLFLYAKLAMDAFLQTDADVEKVLDTLPRDLNAMYNDLLEQHAQRSGVAENVQLLIMQFVTHATRPLRLREIASMINTTQYNPERRNLDAIKHLVRAACGPLLEMLPDETVSVIHHSLTEFLSGITRDEADGGYPILEMGKTHHELALNCLKYLKLEILNNEDLKSGIERRQKAVQDILQNDTFARYAGKTWFIHARKAAFAGADQSDLNSIMDAIFGSEQLYHLMVMSGKGHIHYHTYTPDESNWKFTPVYAATVLGLQKDASRRQPDDAGRAQKRSRPSNSGPAATASSNGRTAALLRGPNPNVARNRISGQEAAARPSLNDVTPSQIQNKPPPRRRSGQSKPATRAPAARRTAGATQAGGRSGTTQRRQQQESSPDEPPVSRSRTRREEELSGEGEEEEEEEVEEEDEIGESGAEDDDIPASPEKPYAHIAPFTRRVRQR